MPRRSPGFPEPVPHNRLRDRLTRIDFENLLDFCQKSVQQAEVAARYPDNRCDRFGVPWLSGKIHPRRSPTLVQQLARLCCGKRAKLMDKSDAGVELRVTCQTLLDTRHADQNQADRNKNGAVLRELLAERTTLLTLIDFGSTRPFPDASAYVACVVARLRIPHELPSDTVQVIEVKELRPEFMASLLLEADSAASDSEFIRSYRSGHPNGGEPWHLLSAKERVARVAMSEETDRLDTLAQVVQGIRTGGNDFLSSLLRLQMK